MKINDRIMKKWGRRRKGETWWYEFIKFLFIVVGNKGIMFRVDKLS